MDFASTSKTLLGSFASISTDGFIIGGLAIIAALFVIRGGGHRIGAAAIALPLASFLFSLLPKAAYVGGMLSQFPTPIMQPGILAALFVISFMFISKIGIVYGSDAGRPLAAALCGVALAAVFVVTWINTPALNALWQFSSSVVIFFGPQYAFWWLLGAFGALAFARRN